MEIILARTCKSITGSLGKSYGYSITKRDGKFYSIRSPKGPRIRDGHLRFIFACAELARDGFLIADIDIRGEELLQAAHEADVEMETILPDVQYNAHDIRRIKTYYEL
jgi:hypothetical protein